MKNFPSLIRSCDCVYQNLFGSKVVLHEMSQLQAIVALTKTVTRNETV